MESNPPTTWEPRRADGSFLWRCSAAASTLRTLQDARDWVLPAFSVKNSHLLKQLIEVLAKLNSLFKQDALLEGKIAQYVAQLLRHIYKLEKMLKNFPPGMILNPGVREGRRGKLQARVGSLAGLAFVYGTLEGMMKDMDVVPEDAREPIRYSKHGTITPQGNPFEELLLETRPSASRARPAHIPLSRYLSSEAVSMEATAASENNIQDPLPTLETPAVVPKPGVKAQPNADYKSLFISDPKEDWICCECMKGNRWTPSGSNCVGCSSVRCSSCL
ncbi:hypothetical protein BCR34DRAFT_567906 [Clohesyomyces aquaticus]|uniref:Uncharacterized protein n=1 Tax=Clohesyomyces aquaticus TaxID=1231657 RepID=A0A1Y1ZHM3_9PLEO|nr:hypothetical protein BCR34DRAFT_567906 [Clohesyomyces aquaticus]